LGKANQADQDSLGVDITPLVPEVYADYRSLVADALTFFLRHLSTPRWTAILAEQQALPRDAGVAQRLMTLLFHCPTLHKLGQVVARNRMLDRELRSRLQTLETMPGTTCGEAIKQVIRHELGDAQSALRLDSTALAEASVSVVVPFASAAVEASSPVDGVLKILKPGIEEALEEELAIWSQLGHFIDERCEYYRVPPLNYAESLDTIRELLAREIRLDHEQHHLAEAAEFYRGTRNIQIPALFPFCTSRITAMERVHGRKVTDVGAFSARQRRRLANSVVEALIAQPVWTSLDTAIFHADPHAGNLFFTKDERLAILDWSLTGYLGKVERIHMVQILLGALTLDPKRIARGIQALAQAPVDASALRAVVDRAVGKLYAGKFPSFRWSQSLLDEASLVASVQFSRELLMYRKSILTLEGVIKDISGESSIGRVFPAAAIRQFVCELTARAYAPPNSRHFGTHVSNLDLLALYWEGPTAAARFWTDRWQRRLMAFMALIGSSI